LCQQAKINSVCACELTVLLCIYYIVSKVVVQRLTQL